MRRIRLFMALLAVCGVTAAPLAHAATRVKVACDLIRDRAGDTQQIVPGEDESSLDIVSGDIATTRSELVAVIRLHALEPADPTSTKSRVYQFEFTANGQAFMLQATLLTGGQAYEAYTITKAQAGSSGGGEAGSGIGAVDGQVDTKRKQIRFVAPLSLFRKYASFSQTYVTDIYANSYRGVGVDTQTTPAGPVVRGGSSTAIGVDGAQTKLRYVPGAPSCLTAHH